jgi:uncharacterized HAD superfamily protein
MIVIDIDNTVTDQMERLHRNYDVDLNVMVSKSTTEEELMKDKLYPYAKDVIVELSNRYDIIWLSARNSRLYDITLNWIKTNGLPCNKLILVDKLEDKLPVLVNLNPKLFIDDLQYDLYSLKPKPALKFIEKLKEAKINFIVFKTSWADLGIILKVKGLIL